MKRAPNRVLVGMNPGGLLLLHCSELLVKKTYKDDPRKSGHSSRNIKCFPFSDSMIVAPVVLKSAPLPVAMTANCTQNLLRFIENER